jgi:triphosphoribosyl-dephospho-CoA synthase
MNANIIGSLAINALTSALCTTIKPGLADRRHDAFRKEKDFFTHLKAINVLSPWLLEIANQSIDNVEISPTMLFSNVRKLGMKAEGDVERAVGFGTLKGSLFHMAVCVAAAGRAVASHISPDSNTVCVLASEMAHDLCQRELDTLDVKINLIGEDSLTPGERMYIKYKFTGARGEVQGGYQTVRKHAVPVIKKLTAEKKYNPNDIYVQTFMTLMAHTNDVKICAKEGDAAVEEMRDRAHGILERGGILNPIGREKIEKLDEHLHIRKMTPSASGSLLAVAIFLSMLDEKVNEKGKRRI